MNLMIPAEYHQLPSLVEPVGQTDQDHCSLIVAGSAGVGEVGEVPVVAAVG